MNEKDFIDYIKKVQTSGGVIFAGRFIELVHGTSPPPPPSTSKAKLTVKSVDAADQPITGYFTVLYSESGQALVDGYTQAEFEVETGKNYNVSVADFGGRFFQKWSDGITTREKAVSIQGDTTITAVYGTITSPMPAPQGKTGTIIPLYSYPFSGGEVRQWRAVIAAKNAHPNVQVVAIVNPNNGPHTQQNPDYVTGINKLKMAGVIVLGYVSTAYTNRSLDLIRADVQLWKRFYPAIDGIFWDEQTNTSNATHLKFYKDLTVYAEQVGFKFTVGNPGADTLPEYLDTASVVLVYESPGLPPANNFSKWKPYRSKAGVIPFNIPNLPSQWVKDVSKYCQWIYVTHDTLGNPWDTVSNYLEQLVALLDQIGGQ